MYAVVAGLMFAWQQLVAAQKRPVGTWPLLPLPLLHTSPSAAMLVVH
jgi:hypothetical protein